MFRTFSKLPLRRFSAEPLFNPKNEFVSRMTKNLDQYRITVYSDTERDHATKLPLPLSQKHRDYFEYAIENKGQKMYPAVYYLIKTNVIATSPFLLFDILPENMFFRCVIVGGYLMTLNFTYLLHSPKINYLYQRNKLILDHRIKEETKE